MSAKKTYRAYWYKSEIQWEASRRGRLCSAGKPELEISSPPEFKGEAGIWTPEDLFVASVNACTMMTFLAYAHHKNLALMGYESEAEGLLEYVDGKYRFTKVVLRPHIEVESEDAVQQARQILEDAHKGCFVTNSTTAEVELFPLIRISPAQSGQSAMS
jgi:organic hydroperoxide reductase OsmC/OhrA